MTWDERRRLEKIGREVAMVIPMSGYTMAQTVVGTIIIDELDQSVTPCLKRDGYWESWVTVWMQRVLQPDWVCVDGGANLGYYTLLMANKCKQVHAFEPIRRYADSIRKTVHFNRYTNVEVHEDALSDGDGWVEFFEHPTHIGSSGTKKFSGVSGQFIHTQSIDLLAEKIGQIDFIKLDIEGAEEQAWFGMERTLGTSPQTLVAMEFDISRYDQPGRFVNDIFDKCHVNVIDFDGEERPTSKLELLNAQDWHMLALRSKNA